jgi:uncharacterized membrane protein YfhO
LAAFFFAPPRRDAEPDVALPRWPWWHIRADGKSVAPTRINGAFLGFLLPPGDHDVRVWYAPLSFRIGVALSC